MRKTSFAVGALLGVLLGSCSPEAPRFAFKTAERRGVLKSNGMRFVIMPDPSTELVEVDVHYDVGSREDPQGKAGLAHLVEHLMFQTRPDGPNTPPIFQTLLDMASFMNAFTNWDSTHYWTRVKSDDLDSMLKIEAMRMFYAADMPGTPELPAFGCSTVPQNEFEREREVVRNEIRAGSSADGYVVQLIEKQFYPDGHAYEREIGGDDVQIAGAQLSDACTFMKKYYAPKAATLVIAGGVDVDKTVALVEKWFDKIPAREPSPRVEVTPFTVSHEKKVIEADVERPSVWIGWALPPSNTPEGEAARFGIGSAFARIAQAGQQYGFAYEVDPALIGGELAPLFMIRIELKGMGKLDEALEFAQNAAKQAYRGWDEGSSEDLEEAKKLEKADFIGGLEALDDRTLAVSTMVQFDKTIDFNSDETYMIHALQKIDKFDQARVGAAVKKALDWNKAGIVVVKPNENGVKGDTRSKVKFKKNSDQAIVNATVDPKEALHPLKVAGQLKMLNNVSRFQLGNGLKVMLLPTKSMPLVTAELVLANAGDASTPDSPALGYAAARFLRREFAYDPNQVRNTDALSRTGINIRCGSNDDSTQCFTHGVNIYLDVMVRGIERQLVASEYDQDTIEQWQKNQKESFKLKSTQEENEYYRQAFSSLYGPDHPYTKTAVATPASLDKVHKDALESFRKKHYRAGNGTLILVGDFDPKYAEKVVRDVFGGMDKGTVDKPVDATPTKRTGPIAVGVTKHKEDQQITISIAYPAPAGVDGQEGARRVLSEMMDIRAQNIRFKRGSTYGLYFSRRPKMGPSSYSLGGGAALGGTVDAERAGESLKALRESLDDMRKGDDEWNEDFVRARRKLVSNLLAESTVTYELAQRLAFIAQYNLPDNYYNTLLQTIAAVSPAQVKALLKRELDPANEVITALGDKAHLDKMFSEAGIKDVKIVEPDYK
ncbi:pitrilysin family protein [soil metagenome]